MQTKEGPAVGAGREKGIDRLQYSNNGGQFKGGKSAASCVRPATEKGRRKLPPYARHLDNSDRSIAVLTGAGAWDRAKSPAWMDGLKLVLPLGDDPTGYRWPVSGRDCIVYSFGDPEPRERLIQLSVELVRAGALFVVWCTDFADLDELTDEELFKLPPQETPELFFPALQARRAA